MSGRTLCRKCHRLKTRRFYGNQHTKDRGGGNHGVVR